LLRSLYENLIRDVGYFVDFDCDFFRAECFFRIGAEVDDFVDARRRPEALVFAGDGDGEEGGPSEDVDGLGGEDLCRKVGLLRGKVCLRSWCATQEAFGAEVFVEVGPVDTESSAGDFPVAALFRGSVEQARIPDQRHADHPTITQGDSQSVFIERDVEDSFICCYRRRTHSTPPKIVGRFRPLSIVSCGVRVREIRNFLLVAPGRAKIWRRNLPGRHGYAAVRSARGCKSRSDTDQTERPSACAGF